jgi:transcriptional regulator with XRE-family HTH domain
MSQPGVSDEAQARQIAFGELLGSLRTIRGWSQGYLAKRSDLDPSSISRFEAGARAPERETVLRLADALALPIPDRDRLLAAAGFRSVALDDPLISELAALLADPSLPTTAADDLRAALRVAIQFARTARDSRHSR